jgi:hypothetical protein
LDGGFVLNTSRAHKCLSIAFNYKRKKIQ